MCVGMVFTGMCMCMCMCATECANVYLNLVLCRRGRQAAPGHVPGVYDRDRDQGHAFSTAIHVGNLPVTLFSPLK